MTSNAKALQLLHEVEGRARELRRITFESSGWLARLDTTGVHDALDRLDAAINRAKGETTEEVRLTGEMTALKRAIDTGQKIQMIKAFRVLFPLSLRNGKALAEILLGDYHAADLTILGRA